MSQSINKIHSASLIQPLNDEDIFYYNGINWVKTDSQLYKVYDDIKSIDVSTMKNNDYVALYKSSTNHILFSEKFNVERKYNKDIKNLTNAQKTFWIKNNLSINSKDSINMPLLQQNMPLFDTKNDKGVSGKVEHSISQLFYNKHNKKLAFSCYVKKSTDLTSNNISLSLFNDTYNIGITAKFDLVNEYASDVMVTNKNYSQIEADSISETSASITYLPVYDCYRVCITGKFTLQSQLRCQLNILNKNNEFKYEATNATEKYSLYISGFQLEVVEEEKFPLPYMTTENKPITKKTFDSLYVVKDGELVISEGNEIKYFDTINEIYNGEQHIIDSYTPQFNRVFRGDIGVVSSILSFSNDKIKKNKEIIKYRNGNKDNNDKNISFDDISREKQIEMLTDCVVKLGSLENENDLKKEFPMFSISYNKMLKEYRFKTEKGFVTLDYSSMKKIYKAITRALTYNQGYFETWSSKGKCIFKHGFNTGGGYNFWKLNNHRH